jgi:hypothetical protein
VLTALRQQRNHPLLHGLMLVLLLSWLALLASATCLMPPALQAVAAAIPDCPAEQPVPHKEHLPPPDCSLKPCLASLSAPGFVFGADRPDLPPVVLWLAFAAVARLRPRRPAPLARPPDPPSGRRIPLIYRYCTLLD